MFVVKSGKVEQPSTKLSPCRAHNIDASRARTESNICNGLLGDDALAQAAYMTNRCAANFFADAIGGVITSGSVLGTRLEVIARSLPMATSTRTIDPPPARALSHLTFLTRDATPALLPLAFTA
jgi:hypothetical protein